MAKKKAHERYIKQLYIISNMKFASRIRKKVLYNADLFQRTQRHGRYGLNIALKSTKDVYEDRGKMTLRHFLFQTNLNLQAQMNFNHVNGIRYKVATMYKSVIESLYSRAQVMEQVFDAEIGLLTRHYSKRKKGVAYKKQ